MAMVRMDVAFTGEHVGQGGWHAAQRKKRRIRYRACHAYSNGSWLGYSVNKRHHMSNDTAQFMKDAATAYSVLALTTNTSPKAVCTIAKH
jgi:hypothetical protein